jgi:ribonuclease P protein component
MYTFKKEERLCSIKLIDELYNNGSSFLLYPFRVTWKTGIPSAHFPVQVVISVPKRKFKRAHDRNLLKRRIREAYRLHKSELLYSLLKEETNLLLGISYIGKEITDFQFIEKKLISVFEKLLKTCYEHTVE